jgi:hypothetical protein
MEEDKGEAGVAALNARNESARDEEPGASAALQPEKVAETNELGLEEMM